MHVCVCIVSQIGKFFCFIVDVNAVIVCKLLKDFCGKSTLLVLLLYIYKIMFYCFSGESAVQLSRLKTVVYTQVHLTIHKYTEIFLNVFGCT